LEVVVVVRWKWMSYRRVRKKALLGELGRRHARSVSVDADASVFSEQRGPFGALHARSLFVVAQTRDAKDDGRGDRRTGLMVAMVR
jgi:hypothetical protein